MIRKTALVSLLLGFQAEAYLVAVPYVLAGLIAFDPIGIPWFGALITVALLAVTVASACVATAATTNRSTVLVFAAAWAIYNGAGLAMFVAIS